jgi:hypothetical protein
MPSPSKTFPMLAFNEVSSKPFIHTIPIPKRSEEIL